MRVLVVEDEKSLRGIIERRLAQENYSVDSCGDGADALDYICTGCYDCVVLDIMLPELDGLSVLRTIRSRHIHTPVLLLTARDSVSDRVTGLDAGADDYLIKPFAFDELSARIRAMLRRRSEEKSTVLTVADLSMDTLTQRVTRGDKRIELTSREYALLEYLIRSSDQVLTRGQIIEHVWNFDFESDSNIIDVYIRYLRRKVDDGFDRKLIHTVRGSGYVLREKI